MLTAACLDLPPARPRRGPITSPHPNDKLNPDRIRALLILRKSGWDRAEICAALDIGVTTYYRALRIIEDAKHGRAGSDPT